MLPFAYRALVSALHSFWPTIGPNTLIDALTNQLVKSEGNGYVHVFRHEDVREVLSRDDDFSVRLYDEKMKETTGEFILGMPTEERYRREAEPTYAVLRKSDAETIHTILREAMDAAIERIRKTGRVDAVADIAEVGPLAFIEHYLGVPVDAEKRVLRLFQTTSQHIFSFWPFAPARENAMRAAVQLRKILDEEVARRRREGDLDRDDYMGRLLTGNGLDDAGIARTIAGLASGAINAPLGLFTYSLDTLLDLESAERARILDLARGAREGDEEARRALRDAFVEAERFNVYPPFSYRYTERNVTLARGTRRETSVPAGKTVVTWQSLAVFDPHTVDDPFAFRPGRPDWQFLGLGHGRHFCLGAHTGQAMLFEMAEAVLALPGLRRAEGKRGRVINKPVEDGRYPVSLHLEFDPF